MYKIMQSPQTSPIQRLINRYEAENYLAFKPSRQFYTNTGINRIRFSQLANGTKKPLLEEAVALSKFFSRFFSTSIEDII